MDFCYTFEKKVKDYIDENNMAGQGAHLVVGVSGGADSLCLLELLYRFAAKKEWKITVVHVHHGIRKKEADEDERFVIKFCNERKLEWKTFHYHVPLEAKSAKEGEEETGRRLRYQALEETLQMYKADKIALAHHKDDQAETVLFHLIRGSNLKGLCGMQPVNENKIRPLLCVDKKEICRYLKERKISYRTDQSNFSEKYARNCLRLRVLPILKEINKGTVENINRAAGRILETEEYLIKQTEAAAVRLGLCTSNGIWKKSPLYLKKESYDQEEFLIQKRILYKALCEIAGSRKNLQERHVLDVDALFLKPPGKRIELPSGIWAKRELSGIWIEKNQRISKQEVSAENPETIKKEQRDFGECQEMFLFSEQERKRIVSMIDRNFHFSPLSGRKKLPEREEIFEWKIFFLEKDARIPKNNYTKWFDYDKIPNAALFRTRRSGDWFILDSSGRRKKLKQYFINEKVPKEQRQKQLLLADRDHIIWIVGGRISEEYKVQETTRVILELKCVKKARHN